MTTHQTTIDGYLVDVDTDMDGEGATGCWVSRVVDNRTYSASLEALMADGDLWCCAGLQDRVHAVPNGTINKIEQYAASKGY
jgi:hypothetical protein